MTELRERLESDEIAFTALCKMRNAWPGLDVWLKETQLEQHQIPLEPICSALLSVLPLEECAQALIGCKSRESGPEYGMMSDDERRDVRQFNRIVDRMVAVVRALRVKP